VRCVKIFASEADHATLKAEKEAGPALNFTTSDVLKETI